MSLLQESTTIQTKYFRNLFGTQTLKLTINYESSLPKVFHKTEGTPWVEKVYGMFQPASPKQVEILNNYCQEEDLYVPKD